MDKNLIPEIAKMLGVEMDERFKTRERKGNHFVNVGKMGFGCMTWTRKIKSRLTM